MLPGKRAYYHPNGRMDYATPILRSSFTMLQVPEDDGCVGVKASVEIPIHLAPNFVVHNVVHNRIETSGVWGVEWGDTETKRAYYVDECKTLESMLEYLGYKAVDTLDEGKEPPVKRAKWE